MRAGQAKMPKSGSVRAQLVSRQQFRHKALFPEQLADEPECRALVATALNQHVENLALVIDGAPQIHPLAGDANDHLVELPPVARTWARPLEPAGKSGPELQNPAPHRLIGDIESAFSEELLHVPVAQCEPQIEPDRVLDDRRREAMSAVGELIHAGSLPCRAAVSVTLPASRSHRRAMRLRQSA